MILIGYPGIGKSSLAATNFFTIDLDSSFFNGDDGTKLNKWYIPYCNVAVALSTQGYDVFVSPHSVVVDMLSQCSESIVAIYPSPTAIGKDAWVAKLEARYRYEPTSKNKAALDRVINHFDEDIEALRSASVNHIEIQHIRYNLDQLIHNFYKTHKCGRKEGILYDERGVARYQRI